jgi:hypothetical protein
VGAEVPGPGGDQPDYSDRVVAALEVAGYKVSVITSAETFTRLPPAPTIPIG